LPTNRELRVLREGAFIDASDDRTQVETESRGGRAGMNKPIGLKVR